MSNIALNLETQSVDDKLTLSLNVDTQMKLHPLDYPGLTVILDALAPKREALEDAVAGLAAAETQLSLARSILEDADKKHDMQLGVTASFVQQVTTLNEAKMEAAGFTVAKPNTPVGALPAPTNLRSSAGANPGTSELQWKRDPNGQTYIVECSTSVSGPWVQIYIGTKARCLATNLISGSLYYFRAAVVGAAGRSPWSDITEKRAP